MTDASQILSERLLNGTLQIGSVRVESKLSECQFGASYIGVHLGLDVPVIVRTLCPELKTELADYPRFMQETRKLGRLRHPSLAGLLDVGEIFDHPYIVVESVQGVPLSERIKCRPMTEAQALQMLLPVAEGLVELWRKGFIHRSLSPYLIHIQPDGGAKLDMSVLSSQYTDAVLKGYLTPCLSPYWSPEEFAGHSETTGRASDMWSLGAVLYHAVTGQPPYPAPKNGDVANTRSAPPPDPITLKPDLHGVMRELLLKLLAPKIEDRFATAEEFLAALKNADSRISRRAEPVQTTRIPESEFANLGPQRVFNVGDVVGNVRLIKKIGSGAFGVVYLGRHLTLEIDVAVKLLPPELAMMDPSYVDMFLREARVAARLRHPNVIGIFEAGIQNNQHYLVMELAPGGTVWERMYLFGGKLPINEAVQVLWDTAQGLSAAAQLNIIHRDIKPDNLMYSADGSVKIADMGLAKRLVPEGQRGRMSESLAADQLSMHGEKGMMSGTPAYMAPEIALKPDSADSRADLYSLGITAYQMLTGILPFEGKTSIETIMKHVQEKPVPPRDWNPEIPEGLNQAIMKLLEKDPATRYQSARLLLEDIAALYAQDKAAA